MVNTKQKNTVDTQKRKESNHTTIEKKKKKRKPWNHRREQEMKKGTKNYKTARKQQTKWNSKSILIDNDFKCKRTKFFNQKTQVPKWIKNDYMLCTRESL